MHMERPDYASFDAPRKFQAIESIIARRLTEYPKAICSYSGGSDSDIMIDLIERTRKTFQLAKVKYIFFNTGLEMEATKRHVRETAEKYGVEIETLRPKMGIVTATRKYGIPFMHKLFSQKMEIWQRTKIPLEIADEFQAAEDKEAKRHEFSQRYPGHDAVINFICGCNRDGVSFQNEQLCMDGNEYMREFIMENPPDFKIDKKCCEVCKKRLAERAHRGYEMDITGERECEGGGTFDVPKHKRLLWRITRTAQVEADILCERP